MNDDQISRKWLMECVDEGWIKFDTEKDKNRYIHLVRDIAPSAQPELIEKAAYIRGFEQGRTQGMIDSQGEGSRTAGLATDAISRQAAIDALCDEYCGGRQDCKHYPKCENLKAIQNLPSAQLFHNITMNDVLKYIDGMSEDVWQKFTACLECRGWELQRRTAKWCGGEFA